MSVDGSATGAAVDLGRAIAALDAVQREPRTAEALATELLEAADATPIERVGARWALGRSRSEADRPAEAAEVLADAVAEAEALGEDALAAEIRVSRSMCLFATGDAAAARAELDRADAHLDGAPLGRLLMQRALLDLHAGRLTDARTGFDEALPQLERGGDRLAACRLLANRGVVHSYLGDRVRAEADLLACHELAVELDQHLVAAGATHNLGYLRGRTGDIPGALASFDQARSAYEALGMPDRLATSLETDLCGVLLAGGLHREAADAAVRAERAAAEGGNRLSEAEARLLHAQARLAQGDPAAEELASRAADDFEAAEREPWAAYARHVALQAAALGVTSPTSLLERAVALVEPLEQAGWRAEAVEVRTVAGRLALTTGDQETARRMLTAAGRDRRRGTAGVRADGWLATAHLRLAEGDRGGARRALRAGIGVVEEHRASFGATELRTRATRHATDLAALGLEMAVDDGRAAELLVWAERWHAGALALAPVRPPEDGRLASLLDQLRTAHADLRDATFGGDPAPAAAEVARLELAVRDASRAVGGSDPGRGGALRPVELRTALADDGTTLVEMVVVRHDLWAVVVDGRRCRAVDLGPVDAIERSVARLLAALRRLAVGRVNPRSLDAALATIDQVGRDLDARLVAPLRLPAEGPLVVVPTGALQSLPWSVLPHLAARELTIAPSAAVWLRGSAADRRPSGHVALISGPDLQHAPREVDALAAMHPRSRVLRDPAATAAAVLDAMEGASTVHMAVHGTFRADNPLFSALEVSDGPLTVYDVERVVDPPGTAILPACDAGMAQVRGGDELIGTAAALLSVGVATVVAPLTIVADDAAVDLVVDLHRHLLDGLGPAAALSRARTAALARGGAGDVAAAHSMVAVGSRRR